MNAKEKWQAADALRLLREADDLYSAKGKKVAYVNLKRDKPDRETLLSLLLGPTGTLRAPTWRKGKTLFVGFNEEAYREILG